MGLLGGGFLRLFQTFLYALAFGCSAIIIGVYSYFLAVLSDRDVPIARNWLAVEGISGVAVVYTIFGVVLTCCLGGISFFAFLAILLNVAFAGAMVAVAVLTRDATRSCTGNNVVTPIGTGNPDSGSGFNDQITYSSSFGTACRLNKAAFAVSIVAAALFLLLAIVQVFLVRHHKKEKRFGPSPSNNYTSGSGKRWPWQRNKGVAAAGAAGTAGAATYGTHHHTRDAEMGGVDTRPSHDTAYTGSTMTGAQQTGAPQTGLVKDAEPVGHSAHGRYYTQPEGTGTNPYGYDNAPARNF